MSSADESTTTAAAAHLMIELPENSRMVQPQYLEKSTSKKDLVRRLRNLVAVLRSEDCAVEAESPEWPGLAAVSQTLVHTYLSHTDKEVRLYTVLACVEILTIYAPEVPWDEPEVLDIFWQMTRQLGNLAHTFEGPVFQQYLHILDLLANVRIGCILVDLANQRHDDEDDDNNESPSPRRRRRRSHKQTKETPLDIFCEFLSTLLHSVRREHPPEVLELVQQAITTCLVEYHPTKGVPFPIPILDLLLRSIGQGPTQWIIAAAPQQATATAVTTKTKSKAAAGNAAAAVQQIEVPNPTYQVASNVIRSLLNKMATPVSQLLNGLLSCEPLVVDQSSIRCCIATDESIDENETKKNSKTSTITTIETDNNDNEVCNIVFELHRVAPQILTTVLGTVANGLRSAFTKQRYEVTMLLGRLFAVHSCHLAEQYAACFREWLGRKLDVDPAIRVGMVQQCMAILIAVVEPTRTAALPGASTADPEKMALVLAETLSMLVTTDPSLDVRMEAIRLICDWAYKTVPGSSSHLHATAAAASQLLLQAVASRVSAKHKQERRDAVTGLAHIYARQFLQPRLKAVVEGGDDCDVQVILKALHATCHLELTATTTAGAKHHNKRRRRHHNDDNEITGGDHEWLMDVSDDDPYRWIPAKVLECVCFTDQTDPEMRSRVVQIVDEVLLGSSSKKQTPTAQAIAWTAMVDSVVDDGSGGGANSLLQLLTTTTGRSNAFKFLQQLLGQRATLQKTVSRYIDARAEIRECEAGTEKAMEADARAMELLELVAKMTAPVDGTKTSIDDVLQDFHAARDKHIFRILATIVNPAQTAQARARALEELPKRTKALGDAVSEWVKNLVKRCAMADSLNAEVVNHCVLLAQECFREGDVPACGALLAAVKTAVDIFPALCSSNESFRTLTELFSECRSSSGEVKKELQASGIVTALSSILSAVAISQPRGSKDTNKEELKNQLTQLCTREGTPEQARNAVYTLARLLNPDGKLDSASDDELAARLQTLTSTSRLKISTDKKESLKVVSILSALSALTDCAPLVLSTSPRGEKVVKFTLEGILLGRDRLGNESGSDDEATDEDEVESPTASSRKQRRSSSATKKKHTTPESKICLLEDENLSVACRRICAAVDFLVSHIRSTTLLHYVQKSNPSVTVKGTLPSPSQVRLLFELLTQIIKDQGLPPSNRDRKLCGSRQDRAALRQCAAVSLLRLCDARLGLEKDMLSQSMWHTLSNAFLDEEFVVREAAMDELSDFFKGSGIYGAEKSRLPPKAPSLRFLSLITLCSDGDREQDVANGSAANVGKVVATTKNAAVHCIVNLRKLSEATYTQCCARGKEAEKRFETQIKMLIMPEYSVPYAFHLLSHRRETPSEGSIAIADALDEDEMADNEDRSVVHDEGQQRTLRKRLKLLFDPLVQSLGDGADNISFLLRMTEILGKHYTPVDVENIFASVSSPAARLSIETNKSTVDKPRQKGSSKKIQLLDAKLKTICTVARDVLLSFVKKDVNLTTYPGIIQLPASLFKRSNIGTVRLSLQSSDSTADRNKQPRTAGIKTPVGAQISIKRRSGQSPRRSVEAPPGSSSSQKAKDARVTFSPVVQYRAPPDSNESFGDLSPIAKSCSPASVPSTRGHRSASQGSGSGPASSADTLGTTPPANLRTATAPGASSDEGSPASPNSSRSIDEQATKHANKHASPSDNDALDLHSTQSNLPSMKSTTQSSEASDVSLSQNSEPFSKRLSQSSGQSSNSSTSRLRKRRATTVLKDKPEPEAKKQKKQSTLPTQIKVKEVAAKANSREADDLDFDFYDEPETENKPVSRNQSKSTKSKKAIAGKGSKANTIPAAAKPSNAKATTTSVRSRVRRR